VCSLGAWGLDVERVRALLRGHECLDLKDLQGWESLWSQAIVCSHRFACSRKNGSPESSLESHPADLLRAGAAFPHSCGDAPGRSGGDLGVSTAFPQSVWRQIWSSNAQERVNGEIRRRSNIVSIFPNREAIIRLTGAVLAQCNDEWMVARRYMSVDALQKAQAAAHEGGSEEQELEQPAPTPVRQLAA